MKKKHEELVHIIRQQKQPISSTQLARLLNVTPVSYTHLDVYKRQVNWFKLCTKQ